MYNARALSKRQRTGRRDTQEGQRAQPLRSFADYYLGTILRPRSTFAALMADERRLTFGALAIASNAALYTLVYIFLTIAGGAPSSFTPWLNIPAEVYYSYNRFMLAPSMLGCWILAAGVAQLLSRPLGGAGSFEDTLSVFGFGAAIATLAALAHDFTDSLLGALGLLDLRAYEVVLNSSTIWRAILLTLYAIALLWMPTLFAIGVSAAQRVRRGPAILVGALGFIVYQGVFFIFNR